jgi:hypothetical protein
MFVIKFILATMKIFIVIHKSIFIFPVICIIV